MSQSDGHRIDETPMKLISIAYLILVHRLLNQFKKLFKEIYDSANFYLIHIDKKANQEIGKDVKDF